LLLLVIAGEQHLAADDCDAVSSSPTLMLDTVVLQKALQPLQQQQQEISEQLTALNNRLSALHADLGPHSSTVLRRGASLLGGNDVFILGAMLLLQVIMLWWMARPGYPADRETYTQ